MELQVIEQNVIVTAYAKQGGTDELYERIAQEARSHVPDVETKKGRDAIGSLALKISKSKTLIEKHGKELVAEQKAKIKLVDDDRISIVKKLDALRDEILAPRDAWEQAEKDRVEKHTAFITSFVVMSAPQSYENRDSTYIKELISEIEKTEITDNLEEFKEQAELAKFKALEVLRKALAEREKYEAEQAELEQLRAAEKERMKQQYEEQLKAQAAEKARLEAESKAKAEQEKLERERLAAEQAQKRAEAEKEAAELRAKEAERQAAIAAQQERERIEREQAAQAEAERQAEAARLANQEHRKQICNEALGGLIALGIDAEKGKEILRAINNGQIPHVSIKF